MRGRREGRPQGGPPLRQGRQRGGRASSPPGGGNQKSRNQRLLRCGRRFAASNRCSSTRYPAAAAAARSASLRAPRCAAGNPGTFSRMPPFHNPSGRSFRRREKGPALTSCGPSCLPALLKGWQGKPQKRTWAPKLPQTCSGSAQASRQQCEGGSSAFKALAGRASATHPCGVFLRLKACTRRARRSRSMAAAHRPPAWMAA